MAAVWKAPVVYVCENNQYMEYTPIGAVTAVERPAADRASAYGLEPIVVDGNDVDAVYRGGDRGGRPRAGRRRTVAHRGPDLPPRRALARGPRQVPARRRGGGVEGARPDPAYRARLEEAGVDGGRRSTRSRRRLRRGRRRRGGRGARRARTGRRRAGDPGLERRGLGMAELTYRAAIAAGIAQEMERDPNVVLIGEDVGRGRRRVQADRGAVRRVRARRASATRRSASRPSSARRWARR